jgi:chromosome partitioning protein
LGVHVSQRVLSTYDLIMHTESLNDIAQETAVPELYIAPSSLDVLGVELEIAHTDNRATRLKEAIHLHIEDSFSGQEKNKFTYILIDCPPSLNLLTINALVAADAVLVPLQCEFFALEGLTQLLNTVEQVKTSLNPKLSIHGVVLTMYDARNNLSAQVVEDVRGFLGEKVYNTIIPRNVRVSEAPSHGKPVLLYDLKCSGSQAYLKLASEIIQRETDLCALAVH